MNYCEEMIHEFSNRLRASAGFSREEEREMALELIKEASCRALGDILEVLRDNTLDDRNCFQRIERIVEIYESLGLSCGERHDF